ncbi:SDR family oxidoreductase [Algiphilus aromaticivorans]|uniref:SDR family oxidoreductase n=1 Tax=Algiphilus aromaticivorans TaxID=382454 RepID=UPI0005C20155|nr:SDR family oxidoreductase [Algiphilus aromaticivorans]
MTPAQTVNSGDVEIAVYEWGEPDDRPTVVLVHGYPDTASVWRATAEQLAERFHVVAYDVRGAGASTRPDHTRAYELSHLVKDLAAVVDTVGPERPVHLVGHDWGSIQSWEAVTTERLAGHIASFTTISGPSLDHAGYWAMERLRAGAPEGLATVARQLAHSWYIGMFHLPAVAPAFWQRGGERLWPALLERVEGIREAAPSPTQAADGEHGIKLYRANFLKRLSQPSERRTDIPVQLIFPKRDHFMVPEIWDDLPRWAPNLWRFDVDAGHWLQVSHPELVAARIAGFVDHIEGAEETPPLRRARMRAARRGGSQSGRLALITGAGSGIGRATALALADAGADIIAVDVDAEAAERTAELCELLEVAAWSRSVDVGSVAAMETLAGWVGEHFDAPDIVVNNAGIGMAGSVLETSAEDWERILDINLGGVIHGSRLFGQQMLAQGRAGHIVNVSSGLAFLPSRSTPAYATTKAAVRMLSDCLRAELADSRIHVAAIYPGVVNTGIVTRTRFTGQDAETESASRARIQKLYERRNLKPEAVADAIVAAVEQRRPEALVGIEVQGLRWLSRLAPGLARRLARIELN